MEKQISTKLPILKHFENDAGNYLTAGIVAAKFPGADSENLSFHRMLVLSKNKVAARVVPRHLNPDCERKRWKVPYQCDDWTTSGGFCCCLSSVTIRGQRV